MTSATASDSNSNSERQCLWCCHRGTATERVHSVHLMNIAWALGSCRSLGLANQV